MIWLQLFFYLIEANANHKNWMDPFPKSIYSIVGRCVLFLGFFFFSYSIDYLEVFGK